MESNFDILKKFIVKQSGVNDYEVIPDARLYEDLGVYGDDAFELLINYGEQFNVDLSKFMAADYFRGEGDVILPALIRFLLNRPKPKYKTLTVSHLEKGIVAGRLDETVIWSDIKKEGLCQVEMGYFQIEDSVIPNDQIVSMYAMHILLNRDLLDHFPDKNYLERYKKLLSNIPGTPSGAIHDQLEHSVLEFYCKCGCHSFFVFTNPTRRFNELKADNGMFGEVAFETNYEEELNVSLFTDRNGLLKQVTIYFGENNLQPIPEDIQIGKVIGIWGNLKDEIGTD
jgi:hypothetical protein